MNEADLTLCIMAGTFCGLGHFVAWYFKLLGTFGVTGLWPGTLSY
jgi:hypothetical protein